MDTLEAIHIDTTAKHATIETTFAFAIVNRTDETGTDADTHRHIQVRWTMDTHSLLRLQRTIDGARGAPNPAIRVTGSITSGGSEALLGAIRARPLIEWTNGHPKAIGLQVEFVSGDPSDADLVDGYCTLGLSLDTTAWSTLHNAVDRALAHL